MSSAQGLQMHCCGSIGGCVAGSNVQTPMLAQGGNDGVVLKPWIGGVHNHAVPAASLAGKFGVPFSGRRMNDDGMMGVNH